MTEIFVNTSRYAHFDVYGATAASTPSAVLKRAGASDLPLTVAADLTSIPSTATERWSAYIPLSQTTVQTEFTILWTATLGSEGISRTDYYEVVAPYATPEQVVARYGWSLDPTNSKYRSRDELEAAERVARYVIETYTGVSFGGREKTGTFYGTNTDVLSVGERISAVTQLAENGVIVWKSDGSVIDFGYDIEPTETYQAVRIVSAGVDIAEYENRLIDPGGKFKDGYRYDITGTYGFSCVPSQVNEAAVLLINDYLSKDAAWRARYMTTVGVRDWKFEFDPGAFRGTGNVVVDQMLAPWLAPWIAVI